MNPAGAFEWSSEDREPDVIGEVFALAAFGLREAVAQDRAIDPEAVDRLRADAHALLDDLARWLGREARASTGSRKAEWERCLARVAAAKAALAVRHVGADVLATTLQSIADLIRGCHGIEEALSARWARWLGDAWPTCLVADAGFVIAGKEGR